jgi:hypothetical protein
LDDIPVNCAYYTYTQNLRLMYTDPFNTVQYLNLGSICLERWKVDDTDWEIIEDM